MDGDPAGVYEPVQDIRGGTDRRAGEPQTFPLALSADLPDGRDPFALLPYVAAYLLWVTVTFLVYAAVIRKLAPQPQTVLLLMAFPGAFLNFFHGQTAFVTAALFGGAMLLLERRPVLAGILIGLMSYKPHFGVLIPLALLCGRHWQAFFAAAVTTVVFAGASALALGIEPWIAFWNNVPLAREVFEDGLIRWGKLPTLYASLRLAGAGVSVAYGLHILLALMVAGTVAWIWWRKPPLPLRAAVLVTGSLLVTPYMFDYDFAILAIPVALIAMDGYTRGWLPYEPDDPDRHMDDAADRRRTRRCHGRTDRTGLRPDAFPGRNPARAVGGRRLNRDDCGRTPASGRSLALASAGTSVVAPSRANAWSVPS